MQIAREFVADSVVSVPVVRDKAFLTSAFVTAVALRSGDFHSTFSPLGRTEIDLVAVSARVGPELGAIEAQIWPETQLWRHRHGGNLTIGRGANVV